MNTIKINKRQLAMVALAFLAGAFWLAAMRFVLYSDSSVHYHANFALFIDGERYPFDRFSFYEEVSSCGGGDLNNPKIRTHMHDQVSHVVHVHDDAATWGHFFANLGMTNGDSVFRVDDTVYVAGEDTQISFMLNGEEITTTANRTIESEDTLLISIGTPSDEELRQQYDQITQDAAQYNDQADPGACSGDTESGFTARLKHAIGLD